MLSVQEILASNNVCRKGKHICISASRTHAVNFVSLENKPLSGVANLEMENSLKWFLSNMVSGETTRNALWR